MRSAKVWFFVAVVMSFLFTVGHTTGFFISRHAARTDPGLIDLTRDMQRHQASVLGFHPSILDFREYFSISFSLLVALNAALSIGAYRLARDPLEACRSIGLLNLVGFIILTILSFLYSVPQGIISAGAIAGCYLASFLLARKR